MNLFASNRTVLAVLSIALLGFTSCSSKSTPPPPPETSTSSEIKSGVPGGIVVETRKVTANVTAVDEKKREVTLLTSDGRKTTVKCGPEVVNFDHIHAGDQLKVTLTEEVAVYMATDAPPHGDGSTMAVALAPKGAKPGGVIAGTVQVTATVDSIDLARHKATLRFPDGTMHTVAVRSDVDLTKRSVGEKVVIRTTEVMALSVEKP